ncbi:hypothetical protein [Lysinibacillus pakistanensis]
MPQNKKRQHNEEKFKQIKEGMTFEEVFNIVGSKGTNCDSNHTV